MRAKEDYRARVLAKIDRRGPDDCWPWRGLIHHAGDAVLSRGPSHPQGTTLVYRFLWEQENGPVPEGIQLNMCKRSDGCSNPAHCRLSPVGKHIDPQKQGRKAMTFAEKLASLRERLPRAIDRRGPNDCWEFQQYIDPEGYGRIGFGRTLIKAHRAAWIVHTGEWVPENLLIRHLCPGGSNRKCCNPAHLAPGTDADNMRDKILEGRGGYERRNMANVPRGGAHWNAKLSDEQRAAIRHRIANHELIKELAAQYGVSIQTISRLSPRRK